MANRLQKFIYLLSAESPILLIIAIVWLIEKSSFLNPITISWKNPLILFIIVVVSIVTFNISFNYGRNHLQIMEVNGSEFYCGDGWMVGYVAAYLFPLITFKFGEVIIPVATIVAVAWL